MKGKVREEKGRDVSSLVGDVTDDEDGLENTIRHRERVGNQTTYDDKLEEILSLGTSVERRIVSERSKSRPALTSVGK